MPSEQSIPLEALRRIRIFESLEEKHLLAHQWEVLLDKFYVHLPLKESLLGLNLVQRVRRLQEQAALYPDDSAFMAALLQLSTALRDFHTMVDMPEPWSRYTALLPFQLHEYFDDAGAARYIVGELAPGVELGGDFRRGVEVTHWNGEPIAHKLTCLAKQTAGSNPEAQKRRALALLTQRILRFYLPPDEDFVLVTYLGKTGPADIKLPWRVQETPQTGRWAAVPALVSVPESLAFRSVETLSGTLGYLRIASFMINDVDGFVREVQRIIRSLPQAGLIIDVRGNPGGSIFAAERILQFFTPNRIEPEPVSLRCTDLTLKLCESGEGWAPWRASLWQGLTTGELFSQGFPLTPVEQANDVGQLYKGPVVLLCDALSYSATDFFIAGFKDHNIGKIMGVDRQTGAGGASMYRHQQLVSTWANEPASPLKPLIRGVAMRVALMRSTRVGAKRGMPVEGLGAEIDIPYRYTRDDILHGDVDLLNRAGQLLDSRP
ncbi:MAG: S41 family peptidase [Hyalangium sp.]|uniref:S41 family peptidase n=1 Tax=Hyalangium sp. TaxID=2028555 RepID=UPI003899A329